MWLLGSAFALLLFVAVILLIKPLLKSYSEPELAQQQVSSEQRKALNIELYEQKKIQLEQDLANGLLDDETYSQALTEVEHGLLQDAENTVVKDLSQLSKSQAKSLMFAMLVFIPTLSITLYLYIQPENLAQIVSAEPMQNNSAIVNKNAVPDISSMVKKLEQKLQSDTNDAQGWNMLGRSYVVLKRYKDAVQAYEKALALVAQDPTVEAMPELDINYVEALMQTSEKEYYQKAREYLTQMLLDDPSDADALWFMGFLDFDAGDHQQAIDRWTYLLTLLPVNSEQSQIVNTYLQQVKIQSGLTASTSNANINATTGVKQAQLKPNKEKTNQLNVSSEQQSFINSMVARVEQRVKDDPSDLKGWKSLGKSYAVLNRLDESADAYGKAVVLAQKDVNLMMQYSNAAMKTNNKDIMNTALNYFSNLADNNSTNLDALFLSGSLARALADNEKAKKYWQKLLPQLQKNTPSYDNVKANLEQIP